MLRRKLHLKMLGFATSLIFSLSIPLIAEPSDQARDHYANGYELQKSRKYRDAVIEFERAVTAFPNYGSHLSILVA